jgi:N-methylhydantoinase B/oxoprolinase/acetone carboxylase alpha subunit
MRATLRRLRPGVYRAVDYLDDTASAQADRNRVDSDRRRRAVVDFTGSAPQVRGSISTNYAITRSAT